MGRPMPGWDVQILDEDEQPRAAGRARRDLPARALEPALSARLLEQRRGGARRRSAASGSTPRTPPRFDEDGYVWYEGRADDVIIAAGYRIGPFEVESALPRARGGAPRRRRSPRPTSGAATSSRRSSCSPRATRASDELVERDPGASCATRLSRLRLPAQDRVRRRAAEDADRQDPPDRAAPGRAGGGEAGLSGCSPSRSALAAAADRAAAGRTRASTTRSAEPYTPPRGRARGVARLVRRPKPPRRGYAICYVNAFQTQDDEPGVDAARRALELAAPASS